MEVKVEDKPTAENTAEPKKTRSLRTQVMWGSAWTILGYGASQVLRLGGHLILTRLLVPESFGMMGIVALVMTGLGMFSDVGSGPAIVRDKRGDDPDFLNTAWTLQVFRGFLLCAAAILIAYPVAVFYKEPQLISLIIAVSLTAIITGFNATAIHSAQRHLDLGRLNLLEFIAQVVSLGVIVVWALFHKSVWALVAGGIANSLTRLVLSHTMLGGIRNKFRWDHESRRVLFNFGKWIFMSSALYFVSKQGDRILLPRYIDMAMFGVYTIALNLCEPIIVLCHRIVQQVLLPSFSRVWRDRREGVMQTYYRSRLILDSIFLFFPAILLTTAPLLVDLLYPQRYHDAGWMLQLLSIRMVLSCLGEPGTNCIVAMGFPSYVTPTHVLRTTFILLGIPIGFQLGEIRGVLWAAVLSELPAILVIWWAMGKHKVLNMFMELRGLLICLAGAGFGWVLTRIAEAYGWSA